MFWKWLDKYGEEIPSILLIYCMTVVMGIQVCARYFFNNSLTWTEELTRYLFIWVGFLSISYCIRKQSSIKIELVVSLFPDKVKLMLKILENIIMVIFFAFMCQAAIRYLQTTLKSGQVSPAMGIPMVFVQVAPLVGFILTVIRSVQNLWKIARDAIKKSDSTPEKEG